VFYKKRILRRTSVLNKGRQNVVIEERFKMKRVLVVGLAVVLAAGNAFAGGGSLNNSSSTTTGSTSSGSTSSNSSSGSSGNSGTSAGQQGGARGGTANHPSGNRAPVARAYPTNVAVPNNVSANANARLHLLDRSELLARQAAYFNRNRVNSVQSAGQSTANTGHIGARAGQAIPPGEGLKGGRHHRDDLDNLQNTSNTPNGPNGTQTSNGRPIPATNTPPRKGRPVLNFNNSDTMSFKDACGRHRDHHDRNWWRNHCTTIILIGGGFYAWDLGYWYPAYGYDNYYSNYAYDGPIYGYDGLPPDQIIANVQYALQQLGYFSEAVDGVLGSVTQAAIEDYQVENNLPVTGAIDRPLLVSLGFIY
jgi:hypothetical protein